MNPSRQRERKSFPVGCGDVLPPAPLRPERGSPPLPTAWVKRRRSRRERNEARFGHGAPDVDVKQVSSDVRGLPKKAVLRPPFWGSQLRPGAHSTPIGGTKAVVITQHRLTHCPQHWGIFNREVKSADIERLLSPRVAVEVTSECEDKEKVQEEGGGEIQFHQSCEPNSLATEDAIEAPPQLLVAPAASEVVPQDMEAKAAGKNKNVPPVVGGAKLTKELAQDLQRLLDIQTLFPGRSAVREARQAVAKVLRKQRRAWPDMGALRMLVSRGGSREEALWRDLSRTHCRDRGPWPGSRASHCGSGNSKKLCLPLRKRRGWEEPFSARFLGQTTARLVEEEPDQRDGGFDSFLEPQASFPPAAVNPHLRPRSASPQQANPFRIRLVSKEQGKAGLRLSQGSVEASWGLRGRLERLETSLSARKPAPRWPRLPFAAHHSLDLSHFGTNSPDPFLSMELPSEERNPDVMWFRGAEPAPFRGAEPTRFRGAEPTRFRRVEPARFHGSHLPDLGAQKPDSQTTFDVLKGIWSPETAAEGLTPPHRSFLGRRFPPSQEWQPKEFLQPYGRALEQNGAAFLSRPNPQQEAPGNGFFLALAKPRTHAAKPTWGLMQTLEGSQRGGFLQPEDDLERLLRLRGSRQSLQAFQRLPMSYFPPSEALEEGREASASSFQGPLLGQASPEPWAFPRMKLY